MKRLADILLSLVLLGPALLICVTAFVLIWIETRSNPLFVQTRVGRTQRPFRLFKLRTMAVDTGNRASHEVSSDQITRTGKFLRRSKIDELPQVLNVLKGDMSFVGPRPCLPGQTELIAARQALGVFAIRPGITGAAQLAGIDMSTPELLAKADAAYLATQSLSGDLRIILQTAIGAGRGDAVNTG